MASNNASNRDALNETHSALLKSLASGISVWFLFLLSGGVVFTVYYARIGYLPDIEWNSALSYLAAASMVGGGLLITLSLLLIAPGLIWTTQLTRDSSLKKAFCIKEKGGNNYDEIDTRKLFLRLVLWLFIFSVLTHWYLIAHKKSIVLLFAVAAATKLCLIRMSELKEIDEKKRDQEFVVYVSWYGVSIGAVTAATYVLFMFLGLSGTKSRWTHFLICTLGLVIANFVVTLYLHDKERGKAFAAAVIFALAIIVIGDRFDPVPQQILANYGFGVHHVRLVVNGDVYKSLEAARVVPDNPNPGDKVISDVTIWCRMGQNYFLEIKNQKVSLRKSDVLAWSVDDQVTGR